MPSRIPGPVCQFLRYMPIDAGTLARVCAPPPGPVKPKVPKKSSSNISRPSAATAEDSLLSNYAILFLACEINPTHFQQVDNIIKKIQANSARYLKVADLSGVPWYVVAVIHNMESSLDFTKHLHNGDPLTQRTIHVPAGRPKAGNPPFTWEESAVDALSMKNFDSDWSLPATLKKLEDYNGTGYRKYHPTVNTPYLWSGSNQYTSGKYVADGDFSSTAISNQIGAAVILKRMMDQGIIPPFLVPAPDIYDSTAYA